jgi:hypothetical protein
VVLVGTTRVVGTGDETSKAVDGGCVDTMSAVGAFVAVSTDGAIDGLELSADTTGGSVEGSAAVVDD